MGWKFQSTLPMRGGTPQPVNYQFYTTISIHPPHAGRDSESSEAREAVNISIHPPHAGRDPRKLKIINIFFISIHPPHAGRDRQISVCCIVSSYFNPPSPCGEGQHKFTKYIWKLMHISQNKPLTEEHTAKYSKFSPILWRILQFSFMRTYRGISVCFPFASLNNQHPLRLIGRFRTEMLNFCLIAVSQIVKSQTVLLLIHDPTQLML